MRTVFDHEKLAVYQRALEFIAWSEDLLAKLPKALSAPEHLDRASTSIPLNVAEGNGKYTSADRCKFFDIARGSALECAACLDVLVAKRRVTRDEVEQGKQLLLEVVSMLVGLIKSNSANRVFEEQPAYGERTRD